MRRLLFLLGFGCAGLVLALATLPWWLGAAAGVVARHYGAGYSRYERIGYARFALHDVIVTPANVHVRVDRIETETPLLWLYHRALGRPAAIVVSNWAVDVAPHATSAPPSANPGGALHTRAILFKVARQLERWAPRTDIGEGGVTWPGGGLKLAAASWRQRTIEVRGLRLGSQLLAVAANFSPTQEIHLTARPAEGQSWQAALTSTGDEIKGWLTILGQRAPVTAQLPAHGWMPLAAETAAENWTIPAGQLALGQLYSTVHGDAKLAWRGGHWDAEAKLTGAPLSGKKAPPLAASLHAGGGKDTFTVDTLALEVPGVTAQLNAPVVFDYHGRPQGGASRFTLAADLAKQPWVTSAKGRIAGVAVVTAAAQGLPQVTATLEMRDVAIGRWGLAHTVAECSLDWPRLRLKPTTLNFPGGGQLTVSGECDLAQRQVIAAEAKGSVAAAAAAPWLPARVDFTALKVEARAHGPFEAIEHDGHGQLVDLRLGTMRPLTVEATWRGTGPSVEISTAGIAAGATHVILAGTVNPAGGSITALKFIQGETERLTLVHPVQLRWSPQFAIENAQLAGDGAMALLALTTGAEGHFQATVQSFPSAWLADLLPPDWPEWRLTSLEARGQWGQGPLTGTLHGELTVGLAPGRAATLQVSAQAGADGLKLESLRVAERTAEIVTATGQLPLTFHPQRRDMVEWQPDAPLILLAATTPNPAFWRTLSETAGLEFQQPEVNVKLSGTWAHPRGEIAARATRMAADPQRIKFRLPSVETLNLHATADSTVITLDQFSAKVEGQDVRMNGRLPLTRAQWSELRQSPLAFFRRAGSGHLEVPDADVAAIARYLPGYLTASGRVQIDAEVKAGGEMSGSFRLRDATTLPLGPLGVLQAVQADVRFEGRTVRIASVTAQTGGQPVTLTGSVELPENGAPRYDLRLQGENLPLVRQTGLLLRADLDLKLATPASGATTVTGNVKLRDSMFLSDVRAFIPKGGATDPLLRPPFFSIDVVPFNAWQLGIEVRGEKFLRLRSPVFVGMASAHFRLAGTLGAPRAIGDAVVDSGQALLPFATFKVDQGTVRLTESDPYSLRIYLTGTSRRYGYDLRMEVTGPATEPIVTFSSSPPLETSQLLLMITAGEVPQDQITYSTNQRVARFGAYLGQSLINDFGGDATDAERLSISSGERVSREGRETYDIEYRLTNRLTLVGEYDEFDDYNAGVKWSLLKPRQDLSKPQKPAEPAKPAEANDAPAH